MNNNINSQPLIHGWGTPGPCAVCLFRRLLDWDEGCRVPGPPLKAAAFRKPRWNPSSPRTRWNREPREDGWNGRRLRRRPPCALPAPRPLKVPTRAMWSLGLLRQNCQCHGVQRCVWTSTSLGSRSALFSEPQFYVSIFDLSQNDYEPEFCFKK